MIAVTALCILKTPDILILRRIARHAIQIMILLLGAGFVFLILNQRRLLFTAFGCVTALCLHFKNVANINLIVPVKTSEPVMTVAHMSTADLGEHWTSTAESLKKADADILSIIEITPAWEDVLTEALRSTYPHQAILTKIDILGTAIFSKYPILQIDTLTFAEVPHLRARIQITEKHEANIYSFNTDPPLFRKSLLQLRNQLEGLSRSIQTTDIPALAVGNYNLDQFADEIQDFRASSHLLDSRKTLSPSLVTPTSHIFYSPNMECLTFENLYDSFTTRIGILGEYQFMRIEND